MDYGANLKLVRKTLNLSQQEFGKKLGLATMVISRMESNETGIKASILTKLDNMNVNTNWIITGKGSIMKDEGKDESFSAIPIIDIQAAAGSGALNETELVIGSAQIGEEFKSYWGKNIVVIRVSGDSMEPTIPRNAWILVHRTSQLKSEGVFVFNHDNEIRCKRIQKKGSGDIVVISDNTLYETEVFPKGSEQLGELVLLGEVVGIINQI